MTKEKRNLECANEIRQWLLDHGMWIDTHIYFNGKVYGTSDKENHYYYNDPDHLIEYEDDPSRYVEYYSKDGITMTFEGELYDLLNYNFTSGLLKEFDAIFLKYGLWYEQGYAWSLSTFEI